MSAHDAWQLMGLGFVAGFVICVAAISLVQEGFSWRGASR